MKLVKIITAGLIIVFGLSVTAQTDNNKLAIDQIAETLMNYIEGTANGEPERLQTAFHSDFNLFVINRDTLRIIDGKGYIDRVEKGKKYNRIGKILSIDYENDAASAKVEIYFPEKNKVATDYLFLLKINGKWKIIHKVYNLKTLVENQNEKFNNQNEINLINETLFNYIEGTSSGQPYRINKAFHKDFNLYHIKKNSLGVIAGEKYISNFKPGKKNNRIAKVLSIDYEGDAANAKIEVLMPDRNRIVIDYMLLLKIKGEWKIIHKSFTSKNYGNETRL